VEKNIAKVIGISEAMSSHFVERNLRLRDMEELP
jgi:hypothetical protein